MRPLSCSNCSHNPLQHGLLGTQSGYCVRHRRSLLSPEQTTCGELFRKDLLAPRATEEQAIHRRSFDTKRISTVFDPTDDADALGLTDTGLPGTAVDAVIDEVHDYGSLNTRFATIAALHRVSGARAEIAMHSIGRAYLRNCFHRDGRWSAGLHLLRWTIDTLDHEPLMSPTDFRENGLPFNRANNLAIWQVTTLRLNVVHQIAVQAGSEGQPLGPRLQDFTLEVVGAANAGDGYGLLRGISKKRRYLRETFPLSMYVTMREALRPDTSADDENVD